MSPISDKVYHLVYHDVGRATPWTRWIDSTLTPDDFRQHLSELHSLGRLVSTHEALEIGQRGEVPATPLFALWFDDGYAGVWDSARAVCQEYGIRPAISVNARFVQKQEIFWRCQLSYLLESSDITMLWDRLLGQPPPEAGDAGITLWRETLRRYSSSLRSELNSICLEEVPAASRERSTSLFMDDGQLRSLSEDGWLMANHSASHLAITPSSKMDDVLTDFEEASQFLRSLPTSRPEYWVMPFDYDVVKTAVDTHAEQFLAQAEYLVRAEPLPVPLPRQIGRTTISPGRPLIEHFTSQPRRRSLMRRIKNRLQ